MLSTPTLCSGVVIKNEVPGHFIRERNMINTNNNNNSNSKGKVKMVKVSSLKAMKAHGGCGCKGPHIHSHGTRKR